MTSSCHRNGDRLQARHAVVQALEDTKANDLLFWASRYHLFVSWSPDGSHPWDCLPAAGQHATLEIGSLRGSPDKVPLRLRHLLCSGDYVHVAAPALVDSAQAAVWPASFQWDNGKGSPVECPVRMHGGALIAWRPWRAQIVVLLDGKPITDYTMANSVLKTTCAPQLTSPSVPCPNLSKGLSMGAACCSLRQEQKPSILGLEGI